MTTATEPSPSRRTRRWNRLSLTLLWAGLAVLLTSAVLLVLTLTGVLGGSGYPGVGGATVIGNRNFAFTPGPTATVPPSPTTPPSDAPIAHIALPPRFEVEAPVIVLGIDANGGMETPEDPWEVAWYDFTARPGSGSNAVFSGHVDALYTGNPGPAVFWNLKDLEQGDPIEVRLNDGTVYRYQVSARYSVDPATADVGKIVGRTEREIITLITCGGDLGTQYEQRLIVQAERVA